MQPRAKIDVGGKHPETIDDVLTRLFWKEPKLAPYAKEFLEYVKEWGRSETPYRVIQWETYCEKTGLTQSKYHNMLKRLKRAGMINKKYNKNNREHEIQLAGEFSKQLAKTAGIWDEYVSR